jgi:hypothetical protein
MMVHVVHARLNVGRLLAYIIISDSLRYILYPLRYCRREAIHEYR